jgi:hypothetical protein
MLCAVLIRRPKESATREEPASLELVAASAAKRLERMDEVIGGSVFRGTSEVAEGVDLS